MEDHVREHIMEITKLGNRLQKIEDEKKEIEDRARYLFGWSKKEKPETEKQS